MRTSFKYSPLCLCQFQLSLVTLLIITHRKAERGRVQPCNQKLLVKMSPSLTDFASHNLCLKRLKHVIPVFQRTTHGAEREEGNQNPPLYGTHFLELATQILGYSLI